MKCLQTIWRNLREQPVLSSVSFLGTALAIFLIMTVVMIDGVKTEPFAPETNRPRILFASWSSVYPPERGKDWSNNGAMSETTAHKLYKGLETAEEVSFYSCLLDAVDAEAPGKPIVTADRKQCDAAFFKIFDYTFLHGKPFTEADFEAGAKKAVVTESLARRLFGTADAVGRDFTVHKVPFTVCGVVKDVSTLASKAYADLWVPYTSDTLYKDQVWSYGVQGILSAVILVAEGSSLEEARRECQRRQEQYDKEIEPLGIQILGRGRPYDLEQEINSPWANSEPDVAAARREKLILFILLLLVPSINLSSMTGSRMKQRSSEIGVRRAYGATRWSVVRDLLAENMAVTLAAGLVALAASVIFAILFSTEIFTAGFRQLSNAPKVDLSILLHFSTFGWALLFCFVLNLLSAGIPAWKASRADVVDALKN